MIAKNENILSKLTNEQTLKKKKPMTMSFSVELFLQSGKEVLATERRCGHFAPIYKYEGLTSYFTPDSPLFKSVLDFQWRPSDVVVGSGPKAGTTWTQEMVWLIANDLNYAGAKKVTFLTFMFCIFFVSEE